MVDMESEKIFEGVAFQSLVFDKVRIQRVHKILRAVLPPWEIDVLCRLGLKSLRVAFFDQGRFLPKVVCFPHSSHFAMIQIPSCLL